MKTVKWNDGLKAREIQPRLFVLASDRVQEFSKTQKADGVAVISQKWEKNGKWSNSDWELGVSDSAIVAELARPFDGWGKSLADMAAGVAVLSGDMDKVAVLKAIFADAAMIAAFPVQAEVFRLAVENQRVLDSL